MNDENPYRKFKLNVPNAARNFAEGVRARQAETWRNWPGGDPSVCAGCGKSVHPLISRKTPAGYLCPECVDGYDRITAPRRFSD